MPLFFHQISLRAHSFFFLFVCLFVLITILTLSQSKVSVNWISKCLLYALFFNSQSHQIVMTWNFMCVYKFIWCCSTDFLIDWLMSTFSCYFNSIAGFNSFHYTVLDFIHQLICVKIFMETDSLNFSYISHFSLQNLVVFKTCSKLVTLS